MSTSGTYAYIHRRPDGTPFYVGKGKLRRARYLGERNAWHRSIVEKYGRGNIGITLIPCATEDVAFAVEVALIRSYRKSGITLCNLTEGGEGTSNPCDETRARISASAKKRGISQATRDAVSRAKRGVKWTDEQKARHAERMRECWKNRQLTPEQRCNLSAAAKKRGISIVTRIAHIAAITGVKRGPHSEATKEKMRQAAKLRSRPVEVRV